VTVSIVPQPPAVGDAAAGAFVDAALGIAAGLACRLEASPAARNALGAHVYDGALGLAFFFGACAASSDDSRWREMALALLAPLRSKLAGLAAAETPAALPRLPVGGLVGVGGFLYALVHLARWLEEPELRREAVAAAALITPRRIAADDRFDVTSGCAGALLALLVLERELADAGEEAGSGPSPLERAVACGERLLAAQVSRDGLPPAWPGPAGRPPLTGFAHGAAGIVAALLRLAARTGREDFLSAARQGVEFERALFDAAADNWLDPRTGRPLEQSAWCSGAPGVALGRIVGLAALDDEATRAEIDRALAMLHRLPFAARDHLCCGNLGRADVLLVAAVALDLPSAHGAAHALAERTLARAEENGRYALDTVEIGGRPTDIDDPTLFRGAAGVGYGLLRLAAPGRLPSILSLT
jgi:lantibiotic modifying enzyme